MRADALISRDEDMNAPGGVDFSSLDRFEKDCLDTGAENLASHHFWR